MLCAAAAPAAACPRELYEKALGIDRDFASVVEKLFSLPPELLSGIRKPEKGELKHLRALADAVKAVAAKELDLSPILPELKAAIEEMSVHAAGPLPTEHGPTEYELKREYQRLLSEINGYLPRTARLPHPRIPPESRDPETWNNVGRAIVAQAEKDVAAVYGTSGFKDKAAFAEAMKATGETGRQLFQDLDTENFDIVIHRPPKGRWWVPRVGFHNQFTTGSSEGTYDVKRRNEVEAAYLGIPVEEYVKMDPREKAKYARVAPKIESETLDESLNWYGEDSYILDLNKIRDRLTWAPTDSLGRAPKPGERSMWDHHYVPWKFRELIAPYLMASYKHGVALPGRAQGVEGFKDSPFTHGTYGYIETQIWGELSLDHVKTFVFAKEPPTGEFLHELKKRNIEIRDGRGPGKPVIWKEGT